MPKLLFLVFLAFFTSKVFAEDLRLHAEKNSLGIVNVYIENTGESPHTILTSNLASTSSGREIILSPINHVWIQNGKKVMLKESINRNNPVTLNPGEITYISSPSIKPETTKITYEIAESWALMHGVWAGRIETNL